ncbi:MULTISPECIES: response regulator [Chromobacterium]|uniref:response regulator n=1 Tax=Chromobacterium TaxID=535 RepID=UPI000D3074A2|nr:MULTISPECIES: response regulator [Chromobacterium]MCP1291498.1 response regulator [Chromobacterium sp. S0633]PTU65492.1 response regulator [Chromobacterium sp. Panama]
MSIAAVDFSRMRILVVDDQTLVRSLISQALQTMGMRSDAIFQTADGTASMRLLDIRMVDLVLCDVQMAPMNGMDLLKELRCGHTMNPSNLPFVFLSGHADRSNVVLASQLHADGFVVKPPKPADVEKAIVAAMQRKRPEIDPFSYYGVSTGTEYDRKVFGRLFDAPALPEAPPGMAVSLLTVKAGAVLAQDLHSKHGHLLLPRGAAISANQITVLRDFSDRYGVLRLFVEEVSETEAESSREL